MTRSIFVAWALAVPSIVQAQTNRPIYARSGAGTRRTSESRGSDRARSRGRGARRAHDCERPSSRAIRIWICSSVRGSSLSAEARRKWISTSFSAWRSPVKRGLRIESATAQITQRSADIDMAALTARAATSAGLLSGALRGTVARRRETGRTACRRPGERGTGQVRGRRDRRP